MARSIVVAALSALMLAVGRADAQQPPALEPPLEAPSAAADPPTPPTVARPKPAEPPHTPLLVIPGVTAPRPSQSDAPRPAVDPLPEPAGPPTLSGPSMAPAPVDIPLRLEPLASEPAAGRREIAPEAEPAPRARTTPPRQEPWPTTARPSTTASPARRPATGNGRILPPIEDAPARDHDASKDKADDDPAAEAAVKRRVEKQVQNALGDRVKDVDVKVSGRSVVVRARATRFWYRFGARRALNALPMPAGYHARVELLD
ncbi:hypothetical protein [Paludisphaera rhizosphaerae]|uniref:hypothetical protein n=1 Tax=Paludisphaera rhizosphaerae TaxID=2711216 RepID=UPI0013ED39D8|nr:hypothetical protein [Paludisphaera rhizosphaerae]